MFRDDWEWSSRKLDFLRGCTRISDGCENCYSQRSAANRGPIRFIESEFTRTPSGLERDLIHVNGNADTFHKDVPPEYIKRIFDRLSSMPTRTFAMLTKRSRRLLELSPSLDWPDNLWMGVTVEKAKYKYRIDDLRRTGAALKFVSFEPLLDDIRLVDLTDIGWVIVGGESGDNARPMEEAWALGIQRQSSVAGIFKGNVR